MYFKTADASLAAVSRLALRSPLESTHLRRTWLIRKISALSLFIDNIFINRFDDNAAEWLYKFNIEYNDALIYDCVGVRTHHHFTGHHKKSPFHSNSVGWSLAPDMCLLLLQSFVFRFKIIKKGSKHLIRSTFLFIEFIARLTIVRIILFLALNSKRIN